MITRRRNQLFSFCCFVALLILFLSYSTDNYSPTVLISKEEEVGQRRIPGSSSLGIDPKYEKIFGYDLLLDHFEKKSNFSRGVWNIVYDYSNGAIAHTDAIQKEDFHRKQFQLLMGPLLQCPKEHMVYFLGSQLDEEKRYCGKIQDFSKDCIVVSVGCNGEFEFEEIMVAKTDCSIEIFDCTGVWPIPEKLVGRARLHNYCLGAKDIVKDGKKFLSWPSLLAKAGVTTAPDYVKMDIERYEYEVLYSVVESRQLLPKSVALELHGPWDGFGFHIAVFLDYMFRFGGYTILDTRDNPYSPCCVEVILSHVYILPDQIKL